MITYDRNRNPITNGSQVMINGTGKTGKIIAIHSTGLTPAQLRRNKTVEVEGAGRARVDLRAGHLGQPQQGGGHLRRHRPPVAE